MIDLPKDMGISKTFNVVDLRKLREDVPIYPDSGPKTSPFEEGTEVGQV